jgi:hypothetical protein
MMTAVLFILFLCVGVEYFIFTNFGQFSLISINQEHKKVNGIKYQVKFLLRGSVVIFTLTRSII